LTTNIIAMKSVLRYVKKTIIYLLGFLIFVVILLYVNYSILSHRIDRENRNAAPEEQARTACLQGEFPAPREPVINLLPVPKSVIITGGKCSVPSRLTYNVESQYRGMVNMVLSEIGSVNPVVVTGRSFLMCVPDTSIPLQGYRLELKPQSATLTYSNEEGLYYGLVTIKVLKQNYRNLIPCFQIEDFPDLEVRGAMLDISRDKVPTLETLLKISGMLADLKYNHLELYVEGFSFAYPSFKSLWEKTETPVTCEEIEELDAFCKSHFIDLVPNQNSLGHMTAWLATDEFRDLAECPKGYKLMGLMNTKSTLDPYDPRSLGLISKMTDDLLPCFSSSCFNMDLDEPFELGAGKSKKISKEKGVGQVYMDYVLKMHDLATARNKKMMMWGDIVLKHKDIISQLPRDITLLDWGYDAEYPFERNCRFLDSINVRYMVCPGTSSWTTITGRTENMLNDIKNAAVNGAKYGADGLLVTDWGDMGHLQYLPVSYAGFAAGGSMSWNSSCSDSLPLREFLDAYIFRDDEKLMGKFVLDMGRYNCFEEFKMFNMTTTVMALQLGLRDRVMINAIYNTMIKQVSGLMRDIAPEMIDTLAQRYKKRKSYDFSDLISFLEEQEGILPYLKLNIPDSDLVKNEYRNAITLIRIGANLKNYINVRYQLSTEEELDQLNNLMQLSSDFIEKHRELWLARNKPGGLDLSLSSIISLQQQIKVRQAELHKARFMRSFDRFKEKITASAVALLMKIV
jgi:hexosaminidase